MMSKNQPCWCGSGKKYKRCHLGRENQERKTIYEFNDDFKKCFHLPICMAPKFMLDECSRKKIKAHTISKSNNLKAISKGGHVLGIDQNFMSFAKNDGVFDIKEVGINNASTKRCFCSKHDKELFSVIEDCEFKFSSEQIFTLSYRTLCMELYNKISSYEHGKKVYSYDKGVSLDMQKIVQSYVDYHQNWTTIVINDLKKQKEKWDSNIKNKNFDSIRYYCLIMDCVPEVMSSGGFIPNIDFSGNKLVDLFDENQSFYPININTVALNENHGAIIFSWDNIAEDYCSNFIKSLHKIPDKYKPRTVLSCLFECIENTFFSDQWWKSLKNEKQEVIKKSIHNIYTPNLKDREDYADIVSWNIVDIKTNIKL